MKYVQGNLIDLALNGAFDCIVHGCNCFHTFGSGIALEIKERLPEAYLADLKTPFSSITKLGTYSSVKTQGIIVVNLYTQYSYGGINRNVDYDAIERGFTMIKQCYGDQRIGIPKIGSLRGGGDWNKIEEIIDSIGFKDLTCVEFTGVDSYAK